MSLRRDVRSRKGTGIARQKVQAQNAVRSRRMQALEGNDSGPVFPAIEHPGSSDPATDGF